MKQDGKLLFCYDSKQIAQIIVLLQKYKFNLESLQFVHPKISKDATLVLVYARKNSKSLVKIFNPLIVFNEENEFTKEVENIYKKSSTYSIKADFE